MIGLIRVPPPHGVHGGFRNPDTPPAESRVGFPTVRLLSLVSILTVYTMIAASCLDRRSDETDDTGAPLTEGRRAHVVEVVRSDPSAQFSLISSIAVAGDGRVFVADAQNAEITILGPGGEVVGSMGRRGEGPGEFRELRALQMLPGDSLLAHDFANGRITVYEPDGYEVAYTTRLEMPPTASRPEWFARATGEGRFIVSFVEWVRADRPPAAGEDEMARTRIVRTFDSEGRLVRDSALVVPTARRLIVRDGDVIGDGGPHPFGPWSPITHGGDDRLYVGGTSVDSVRVDAYTLAGEFSPFFAAPIPPLEVTPGDIEQVLEGAWSFYHDAIRETVPERWPAVRDLTTDDRGRIWITLGGSRADSTRVWVVDPDGSLSFRITLAPGLSIEAVRGDVVYGILHDELDVPWVESHRVAPVTRAVSVSGDI